MPNKIFTHFTKTVSDYDTVADKVVMKNDELHDLLIQAIPFKPEDKISILDLGCGTGHGMNLILKKFPKAMVTGIDYSAKMTEKSEKNLETFSGRYTLLEQNFNEIEFPQKYDAIVSAVAIHNSTHAQKRRLFKRIYASLNKNGVFINGDFITGENKEIDLQYKSIYRKYLKNNLSGAELKVWLKHAFEEDMPIQLSKQFAILKMIGFRDTELIWQLVNEAVYISRK